MCRPLLRDAMVRGVLKGFRDFITRGNVVDLAVAVVIGAAFTSVVKSFSDSFILPLIKVFSGGKPLSGSFHLRGVAFPWADFVNAALSFLITAAVVYFIFVLPMNKMAALRDRRKAVVPATVSDEIRLLSEIRDALVARRNGDAPR